MTALLLTAFDLLLIAISLLIFLVGVARLKASWRMGCEEDVDFDLKGLLGYVLNHQKVLQNPLKGMAHLLVFWGFVYALLMGILPQFGVRLPSSVAGALSLFSDLLGLALFCGLLFFLLRRINSDSQAGPKRVIAPVILLLVMVLSGFLAEGTQAFHYGYPVAMACPPGRSAGPGYAVFPPVHADHDPRPFFCFTGLYCDFTLLLHAPSDFRKPQRGVPAKTAPGCAAQSGSSKR